MQYLFSVIHDQTELADGDEREAVVAFNTQLKADGHWVFAGGLGFPDSATVVDHRAGEPIITDGPFVESKEFLAGFWVLEAPDFDVAMRLAVKGSRACNRKIEVRPFQ